MRAIKRILYLFLIAAVGWAILAPGGCRRAPEARKDPIYVVTTVYAMADIVRTVGGASVNVEWFVESGQSLEELTETPQRRQQARSAELMVTRGAIDPWTLAGAGNEFADRRIVRVDDLPSARETDPRLYMWLDPQVGAELCDAVAAKLSAIRPEEEKQFKANAADLRKKILAMTDAARPALDASNGTFITVDAGFASLARRMALDEAPLPAIRLDDPTTYGANAIRKAADEFGARAIFANAQTPTALLHDWEVQLKLAVLPLDATGSSALSGRSSYLAILEYNLSQLREGMTLAKPRARRPREPVGLGAPITSEPEFPLPSTMTSEAQPEPEPETPGFKEPPRIRLPGPTTLPTATSPFNPIPYNPKSALPVK